MSYYNNGSSNVMPPTQNRLNNFNMTNMNSVPNTMPPTPSMNTNYNLFPQTQGNVYFLNNIQEINNIPVSNGVSAAFSLSEGILYLKTIQNGSIILNGYRLSALEQVLISNSADTTESATNVIETLQKSIEELKDRVAALEKQPTKEGGNIEW